MSALASGEIKPAGIDLVCLDQPVDGWQGLFAPAGTPRPIVDKIAAEVNHAFGSPDVVKTLTKLGGNPAPMGPDAFAAFITSERPKWGKVVKAAGVHID